MDVQYLNEKFPAKGSGLVRSDANVTGKYHLTDVIHYIEHTMGWSYSGNWKADMWVTMEVGFIWEDALTAAFANRMAVRLDEIELDGIVGSPDGIGDDPLPSVLAGTMALEEYKCTWKSSRKDVTDKRHWNWHVQTKSYCYMLSVNVVVMRILYLMGNYRGSGPQYVTVRIEYTDEELIENWAMIISHRDRMIAEHFNIVVK